MNIRTISVKGKRAQVVMIQEDPARKGKNTSETRHLICSGGNWTDTDGNLFTLNGTSFTAVSS